MPHKIAVTGSAGVIGRELVARLLARGDEVLSLDRERMHEPLGSRVKHVQVDLSVGGMEELRRFRPQTIYHLAAAFERSEEESGFWLPGYRDNMAVTHRLHDTIRSLGGLETYVFASSYLIYAPPLYLFEAPQARPVALHEQHPVAPRNLCGAAKYYGETELRFLSEVDGLPLRGVAARIFRVYGRGSRDVISRWVRALLADEPIEVYNPENRFDYIFAGDVAEGLLRLAASSEASGVVNLATGTSRSIAEAAATVLHATGAAPELVQHRAATGPYEASAAAIGRLSEFTGWQPTTTLEDGIDAVVEYERAEQRRAA
ncbi:MAG TPA: NAD-dependent epimerase/dehydratase family protein [Stellaceae bacterium]|nr:NAD-dependent epimerase/dehydratase family protein [Stellaceae bacterium]